MGSTLIITSIENLQNKINFAVKSFQNIPGIYISLNKTQKSMENLLEKAGINTKKMFFIDCVTSEKTREDVLHINPYQLKALNSAINHFIKEIKGEKFLVMDALSSLLIYNDEDQVTKFIKEIIEFASQNNIRVVAFSPKTKGEELLKKIFGFFDLVDSD